LGRIFNLVVYLRGIAQSVGASAIHAVGKGFDSFVGSYQKTLKMVFTASLLGAQQIKRFCEEKAGKLACCVLGKGI